jgi:hypothetical protein
MLRRLARPVRQSSRSSVLGAGGVSVILSHGVCADVRRVSCVTRLKSSFSRMLALSTVRRHLPGLAQSRD